MLLPSSLTFAQGLQVRVHERGELAGQIPRWSSSFPRWGLTLQSRHPAWLCVLAEGLKHTPFCLEVFEDDTSRGILPLAYVQSVLFGRFLVSLPYVNYGGPLAENDTSAWCLIDHAVQLADRLNVRYLELRHEQAVEHPALVHTRGDKVHMRRMLPESPEALWKELDPKVRNQIRKAQKNGLTVAWGGLELLTEFYTVFSGNMRDLGTPVFGRGLFANILHQFPEQAEFCIVRAGRLPVAAALLLHGSAMTEVPSAGSLRKYNPTCANMLLYWHLLERAVERGQSSFDFGRSSRESTTYRFKKQWGAEPEPAEWQYYLRQAETPNLRTDNPRYQRLIRLWQRLPVSITRLIGPPIVRGIP